jgi:GrpB-like predicted nucleotidyltransferase (UPF0157 family)
MPGAMGPRPHVVPYRSDWPARAGALIEQLRALLAAQVERIEHIGSTSIPGMAAKDLLDLQASAADLEDAALHLDAPLARLGFVREPYEHDHVPAGQTEDPQNWTKRLWTRRGQPDGDVNLHLRRSGSPNERLALLFRDWFRAHPEAIAAYSAFKQALAALSPDTCTYSDVKDPVVDLVIALAEPWTESVHWQP